MKHRNADMACLRLAARQQGVIAWRQTRRLGFSKHAVSRRVRAGRWEQVLPFVFRLEGSPRRWPQNVVAAFLCVGSGAVSHAAAAALWELQGFRPGEPIEVTATRNLRPPGAWPIVHQTDRLERGTRPPCGGLGDAWIARYSTWGQSPRSSESRPHSTTPSGAVSSPRVVSMGVWSGSAAGAVGGRACSAGSWPIGAMPMSPRASSSSGSRSR